MKEWEPPEDICPFCHRVMHPRKCKRIPHLTKHNRAEVESLLREALERTDGNRSAAARDLGVSNATVFRLVRKLLS